jgi:3'-5' exoribonuclease
MKFPLIGDLKDKKLVTGVFLVQSKEVRQKKTGDPYLSLVLSDRSGDIDAKMWDNVAEVISAFERDDFIEVKGLSQVYNNRLQFTIHKLRRVEESEVELADFFPCSKRDSGEMLAALREIIAAMRDPHLRALIQSFR